MKTRALMPKNSPMKERIAAVMRKASPQRSRLKRLGKTPPKRVTTSKLINPDSDAYDHRQRLWHHYRVDQFARSDPFGWSLPQPFKPRSLGCRLSHYRRDSFLHRRILWHQGACLLFHPRMAAGTDLRGIQTSR